MQRFLKIIAIILLLGQSAFAEGKPVQDYSKASVSIKYYDRTVYYPNEKDTNPINIHITIKNTGNETLRFKLADDRAFSNDFIVYTARNNRLSQTEELIQKRTTNTTVYFREISLEKGEEYSFVENVKDYINISEASVYYVELSFYPELYKSKYLSLESNRLTLEVHPSPSAGANNLIPVKNKTQEILQPMELSPDKVVEQTIIARQKSLWNQYFLYMDIPAMLQRNPSLKRKYNTVSADERNKMEDSYKNDLMASRIDNDIIAIPEKFQIEKTSYTPTEGTVTVIEWFKYTNYYEKKSYTYKVRQREGIWQIYDYVVVNLGTE
ncbi:MAG: hypothetical protein HUK25_01095 [Treponema sp.]|nr:hypothetical protein [Treponema sp.]